MSRTDYTIKRGDTKPALAVKLIEDGTEIDVYDTFVVFQMEHVSENVEVYNKATILGETEDGTVAYEWAEGDTDITGTYEASFGIDYKNPDSIDDLDVDETFPKDGYLIIKVEDGLFE